MKKFITLFSHELTMQQIEEIDTVWQCSKIVNLPSNLQKIWSQIDPVGQLSQKIINDFIKYLLVESSQNDLVLVQGELGIVFIIADWCLQNGRIPIYATTRRNASEKKNVDGSISLYHNFEHIQFRKFQYWK